MTKIYSYTQPVDADTVDAFCILQKGFTDQFVYYDKARPTRYLGLGRCVALGALADAESILQGPEGAEPVFFSFGRFDAENPKPPDALSAAFPRLALMLPELVLIENERGRFLQVNSLGPVYEGRVGRFARQISAAPPRCRQAIPYRLECASREDWEQAVAAALSSIRSGRISKVVVSRRQKLTAKHPFSSKDLLVNLIDGPARGTVLLYRYGDVFFCGCTPELLIRKRGSRVEGMCLAGTVGAGTGKDDAARLARKLLSDGKNLHEHAAVVEHVREVFRRNCHNVEIPEQPGILSLPHVQHLHTPVRAEVLAGKGIADLVRELHPTPAVSGTPVGEALMLIRAIEPYNRGFFGGAAGYVDGGGDGEFSVALRTGVFDGEVGWVYAGCGIVEGSVAADEFDETGLKLKTILGAFGEIGGSAHA